MQPVTPRPCYFPHARRPFVHLLLLHPSIQSRLYTAKVLILWSWLENGCSTARCIPANARCCFFYTNTYSCLCSPA
jgi:hypothetical protein